ncbi:MAG: prepilin-type N-terminal cleavage/methylation domain-containing protein [Patescibacteria group bacterium]
MGKKPGFTLIEILIVVAIIAILVSAILVSINNSRKKARINSAKTSVRSALPIIVSCKDSGGIVSFPANPMGGNRICNTGYDSSFWPPLVSNYQYGGGVYDSKDCNFQILTNGESNPDIACDCNSQMCQ